MKPFLISKTNAAVEGVRGISWCRNGGALLPTGRSFVNTDALITSGGDVTCIDPSVLPSLLEGAAAICTF
jgi:hypothetical protein